MVEMAETFETSVRSVLDRVSRAAGEMQDMAQRMTRNAETTTGERGHRRQHLAAGRGQRQGGRRRDGRIVVVDPGDRIAQVTASSRIARKAAEDAERTDRTVEGLSATANKIGEVVNLINDIASARPICWR